MPLNKSESAHRTAGLVYCLWLLGILFGITAVIGIYINHSKLASVRGTHAYSHFLWQIGSFWTVFTGAVIAIIFWPLPLAKFIAIACFAIWIFSGMIGSYFLAKSRKLSFFDKQNRLSPRDPRALREHEVYDVESIT